MPTLLAPLGASLPRVRRIAVLRAEGIGDFVMALPALAAVRAAYPDAHLTVLGGSWAPELMTGRPGPWDGCQVVPRAALCGEPGRDVDEFVRQLREPQLDVVLQLHGGGKHTNPLARSFGARLAAGMRAPGAAGLDRTVPYHPNAHEVLRLLEVVALVGAPPVTLEPQLQVIEADVVAADRVLENDDVPVVALHPGARDPRRRWPVERFAVLADELVRRGARVVVIGGPEDTALGKDLSDVTTAHVLDLTGRLALHGTLGLLKRCALMVGNDSGPRHLAESVGTATVGIFLGLNLISHGPLLRRRHRVLVSFRTSCPECGQPQVEHRCEHDVSFAADVATKDVVSASLELFDQEVGRP